MRVGKDDFYLMLKKMGFGCKTGVELPAETNGILRSPDKWTGDSLASMSIGYEISVTALQMATAFATIANNGIKVQPRIIKEIRSPEQQTSTPVENESVVVISEDAAKKLKTMLRQVVLSGTGKRAQLNGYTSAGKTGTAWKFDPVAKRVDSSRYISSFIGFAPADDPEIVIAVVIDEPRAGGTAGGTVAAPVFREIAEQILPELGVKPDGNIVKEADTASDIPESPAPNAADVNRAELPAKSPTGQKVDKDPSVNGKAAKPERKAGGSKKEPEKKREPDKKQTDDTTALIETRNKSSTEKRALAT
jgi:cell division protein FtsI (penicillin-binding protein 3)